MEAPGNDVRRSNKHTADQERIGLLLCCKLPKIIERSSSFGPSGAAWDRASVAVLRTWYRWHKRLF